MHPAAYGHDIRFADKTVEWKGNWKRSSRRHTPIAERMQRIGNIIQPSTGRFLPFRAGALKEDFT